MPESIGERLRRIRKTRGLTQVQLAQRSGIMQQVISRYESGHPDGWDMSLRTATKLARGLGVSLDVLAGTWEKDADQADEDEEKNDSQAA
jgi:transcriptional regulator with XRE-family HTH domain